MSSDMRQAKSILVHLKPRPYLAIGSRQNALLILNISSIKSMNHNFFTYVFRRIAFLLFADILLCRTINIQCYAALQCSTLSPFPSGSSDRKYWASKQPMTYFSFCPMVGLQKLREHGYAYMTETLNSEWYVNVTSYIGCHASVHGSPRRL